MSDRNDENQKIDPTLGWDFEPNVELVYKPELQKGILETIKLFFISLFK